MASRCSSTGYGVRSWAGAGASSASYTTFKNLVAALFLGALAYGVARRAPAGSLRPKNASQWRRLGFIGVIGGGVPFLLFFEGLTRIASASRRRPAFIHKTLLLWVAVLAVPFLTERLTALHLAAMGLLVAGQAYLTGVGGIRFGAGEAMILGATLAVGRRGRDRQAPPGRRPLLHRGRGPHGHRRRGPGRLDGDHRRLRRPRRPLRAHSGVGWP